MSSVRIGRGFLRLWIALSILWVIGSFVVTHQIADNVSVADLTDKTTAFDDLIPAYSTCWDYRTEDGKRIDRKSISNEALLLIARCQEQVDKKNVLWMGAYWGVGVPAVVLFFGFAVAWIYRGFVPSSA